MLQTPRKRDDDDPAADDNNVIVMEPFEEQGYDETNRVIAGMTVNIPDEELLFPYATREDIFQQVALSQPKLALINPVIAAFEKELRARPQHAPIFQTIEFHPTDWAAGDPAMDAFWLDAVAHEPFVENPPDWLALDRGLLSKPFGAFDAPLMILSSCPSMVTTDAPHFSIVNDLSNRYMFDLYSKIGFHRVDIRSSNVLHIDIFPRQINLDLCQSRKQFNSPQSLVPDNLRSYWEQMVFQALKHSRCMVVMISERYAVLHYQQYIDNHGIPYTVLQYSNESNRDSSVPAGWLQYHQKPNGVQSLVRTVLDVLHPEAFMRNRGHSANKHRRQHAIQERLIIWAITFVYIQPYLPGYLSMMGYFRIRPSGVIIPKDEFTAIDRVVRLVRH